MERKRAEDFDQDLLILFDAYVHGDIDRRGFLEKAARFAAGGITASMLLGMLAPKFAEAHTTPKPRSSPGRVRWSSSTSTCVDSSPVSTPPERMHV